MTDRRVYIDPGVAKGCAYALFEDATLVLAIRSTTAPDVSVALVVIEAPVYQGARTDRSRSQDLIDLTWTAGITAGLIAGANRCSVEVLPATTGRLCGSRVPGWKGTKPKPMVHAAGWSVLTDEERDVLGGAKTAAAIRAAQRKGALSRWKIDGTRCYPSRSALPDILDAVCMGLVDLRRLTVVR